MLAATAVYKGVCWSMDAVDENRVLLLEAWQVSQERQDSVLEEKVKVFSNILHELEVRNTTVMNELYDLYEHNMTDRQGILLQVAAWSRRETESQF